MVKEILFVEDEVNEEVEMQKQSDINNEFIRLFVNTKMKSYLSFNELLELVSSKMINDISDIIKKYINNLISITDKDIFIYNESLCIHHKLNGRMDADSFLSVFIITLVENSIKQLDKSNREFIQKIYNTSYVRKQVLQTLKTNLRVNENTFNDPKLGEVHFKNGYIKLKTLTFHKRKRTDHMTYCIFRDYKKAPKEKRQKLDEIYNQVYPIEQDKHCVFESFVHII